MLNNLIESEQNLSTLYYKHVEGFRTITKPIKDLFQVRCGYMLVFRNYKYYIIADSEDFIKEFSSRVKRSYIFCSKNITGLSDYGINFTLWPDKPTDMATEICYKHNYWNGITVSKVYRDHAELWWFCGDRNNTKIQQFIASNKILLISLINCFNGCLKQLNIPKNSEECPYTFAQGFDITTLNLVKKHIELEAIKKCISDTKYALTSILAGYKENIQEETKKLKVMLFRTGSNVNQKVNGIPINEIVNTTENYCTLNEKLPHKTSQSQIDLSQKEIEVISLLSKGLTYKIIANELNRSPRTVEHHIESIKAKLSLNCKTDIIRFFQKSDIKKE